MSKKTVKPTLSPIVVLPISTDAKMIAAVKAAGYLPVLTDEPDKVRIITPHEICGTGDLLMAALTGLTSTYSGDSSKAAFTEELFKRLKAREPKSTPLP